MEVTVSSGTVCETFSVPDGTTTKEVLDLFFERISSEKYDGEKLGVIGQVSGGDFSGDNERWVSMEANLKARGLWEDS